MFKKNGFFKKDEKPLALIWKGDCTVISFITILMTDDDDDIDDDETNRPEQVWNQFKFDGVLAVDLLGSWPETGKKYSEQSN